MAINSAAAPSCWRKSGGMAGNSAVASSYWRKSANQTKIARKFGLFHKRTFLRGARLPELHPQEAGGAEEREQRAEAERRRETDRVDEPAAERAGRDAREAAPDDGEYGLAGRPELVGNDDLQIPQRGNVEDRERH